MKTGKNKIVEDFMMRTKLENKKYLAIILLFAILSTFVVLPKNDVYAASASVSISMPSSVAQGQDATATITVTATGNDTPGIYSYLLRVTGGSSTLEGPTGTGLSGTTKTETARVTVPLSSLGAGQHTITVSGAVTVWNEDRTDAIEIEAEPASTTITIVAPTTATTTRATTTATTTRATTTRATTTRATTSTGSTSTTTTATTSDTTEQTSPTTTAGGDYTPISERRVTTTDLDIRQGPSLSSTYLGEIAENTVLDVKGITASGWYVIDLDGQDVYLAGSYLREYDEDIDGTITSTTSTSEDEPDETTEETTTEEATTAETTTEEATTEETTAAELTTQEETTPAASEEDDESGLVSPNTISIIIGVLIALLLVLVIVYIILRRRLSTAEAEQDDLDNFDDYEDL